ncbi:MAG: type II toxin-antitoxin system VapC family toxin [Chloroflexota bacterium]|nr:type II toxin-antitoxin system VapC family toxin [Chloroflexota bacterium]
MRYLLDTSAFLWYVSDHQRLSSVAAERMKDPTSIFHLSLVSIWEVAIKFNMGKLDLPLPFDEFVDKTIHSYSLRHLNIQIPHLRRVARMPLHHRDPFDRLLIAQSQVENIPVITSDAAFDSYEIQRVW